MLAVRDGDASRPVTFSPEADRAFEQLVRHLGLEFELLWSTMYGYTQRALTAPDFQTRDEMLSGVNAVSSCGLLYSRNLVDLLTTPGHELKVFDVCALVREWAYKTNETLLDLLDLSCLVPPHPVDIFFDMKAMRLILLTLATYALRSYETNGWSMIGVRSAPHDYGSSLPGTDHVDIMFLCRPANRTPMADNFDKQFVAIQSLVKPFAGVAETWTLPSVGTNVRIRFPVATAGAALAHNAAYPVSPRSAD